MGIKIDKGMKNIPVRYTYNVLDGKSITTCHFIGDKRIGSMGCTCCQYFKAIDPDNLFVECTFHIHNPGVMSDGTR